MGLDREHCEDAQPEQPSAPSPAATAVAPAGNRALAAALEGGSGAALRHAVESAGAHRGQGRALARALLQRREPKTTEDMHAEMYGDSSLAHAAGGGSDFGYEFSDDPLSAGGFGPDDQRIAVRPGPVRATLIRPKPGDPKAEPWYDKALARIPGMTSLPEPVRKQVTETLKSASEYAWEEALDHLPIDDAYKKAVKGVFKALWNAAHGQKEERKPQPSRVPDWTDRTPPGVEKDPGTIELFKGTF